MESTEQMLRPEALAARSSAALGVAVLVTPMSLRIAVALIFSVLCAGVAFLYFGIVPTMLTAPGKVEASVEPTPLSLGENAMPQQFLVEDGQTVAAGTPLLKYCLVSPTPTMLEPTCNGASRLLRSPSAGSIAMLSVRVRDAVSPATPVLALHQPTAPLKVLLKVPETAVGDIRIGQRVRMRYARYDAQRYRDAYGRITKIASAPIAEQRPNYFTPQPTVDQYEVTVRPERSWVEDGKRRVPLQRQMSVEAKVITRESRVYEWLWMRI